MDYSKLISYNKFAHAQALVDLVLQGKRLCAIISGPGGSGKTTMVEERIKEFGNVADVVRVRGYISAYALYCEMFYHPNALFILDDADAALYDLKALNLIKTSIDDKPQRIISYRTKATVGVSEDEGIPAQFEFKGRLIILTNEALSESTNRHVRAMMSRPFYELSLTFIERLDFIEKVILPQIGVVSNEEKKRIFNQLRHYSYKAPDKLTLRSVNQVIDFYLLDKNKLDARLEQMFVGDEDVGVLFQLASSGQSVKNQVEIFEQLTGKSRPTYFRLKKKYQSDLLQLRPRVSN